MALNQQITELQAELNSYTAQKMAKSKLFAATFKRDITLDDFIKLPRIKDAEEQLSKEFAAALSDHDKAIKDDLEKIAIEKYAKDAGISKEQAAKEFADAKSKHEPNGPQSDLLSIANELAATPVTDLARRTDAILRAVKAGDFRAGFAPSPAATDGRGFDLLGLSG